MADSSSGEEEENYWPGYVDALTTMVMVLTFIMMVLGVVVFSLSQNVSKIYLDTIAKAAKLDATATSHDSTDATAADLAAVVAAMARKIEDLSGAPEKPAPAALPAPQAAAPPKPSGEKPDTATPSAEARPEAKAQAAEAKPSGEKPDAATPSTEAKPEAKAQAAEAKPSGEKPAAAAAMAEPKSEAKPDAKPEAKSEAKSEVKSEPQPEAKARVAALEAEVADLKAQVAAMTSEPGKAASAPPPSPSQGAKPAIASEAVPEKQLEVSPPEAAATAPKADMVRQSAGMRVVFRERSIRLDDAAKAEFAAFITSADMAASKARILLKAPALALSGGPSEARRVAYYRAMAVRQELVQSGIAADRISIKVEDGTDQADANTVLVGLGG